MKHFKQLLVGGVDCDDVTGYIGGSVLINCYYTNPNYINHTKYFCKLDKNQCMEKFLSNKSTSPNPDQKIFFMEETQLKLYSVLIKNISQQDAGTYRCGVENRNQFTDVELKVEEGENQCCNGSTTVIGYLGSTVTINCFYPEQFKENTKYLYKWDGQRYTEIIESRDFQRGRFSISEDKRSRVVSLGIRDVREDDGGVYYCGVRVDKNLFQYESIYRATFLQISGKDVSYMYTSRVHLSSNYFLSLRFHILYTFIGGCIGIINNFLLFFSVRISDLREMDGGLYSCGLWVGGNSVQYKSIYKEIVLSISGPASCLDVIGYSRGSIIIYCYNKLSGNDGYFCKESTNQCVFLESAQKQNSWDHKERVSLTYGSGYFRVFYKDLSLKDAGLYWCGGTGGWSQTVNLRVKTDPCCLGPKTVIGYPGETTTISCSYPEEFQNYIKYFYKLQDPYVSAVIRTRDTQKGRFSISDNRRSRVLSVRISDVREDDVGVYYCGALIEGNKGSYLPLYTEIHLQVSGEKHKLLLQITDCIYPATPQQPLQHYIYYKPILINMISTILPLIAVLVELSIAPHHLLEDRILLLQSWKLLVLFGAISD
uniref:Ig-like domain-containing protein n=1 Tax=Astyanax mexicanus TaxID=7994 RepID=W5LEN3_ASTMX